MPMSFSDLDMNEDVPLEEMSQDEIDLWTKTLESDKETLEVIIKDAQQSLANINKDLAKLKKAKSKRTK